MISWRKSGRVLSKEWCVIRVDLSWSLAYQGSTLFVEYLLEYLGLHCRLVRFSEVQFDKGIVIFLRRRQNLRDIVLIHNQSIINLFKYTQLLSYQSDDLSTEDYLFVLQQESLKLSFIVKFQPVASQKITRTTHSINKTIYSNQKQLISLFIFFKSYVFIIKMKFCTQNQGITIWMTGLSGAGKTTLASALKSLLQDQYGRKVIILDGDKLRTGINMGLGFSRQDRSQNIRRVSEMAKMLNQEGLIVVTACISPYREDRDKARRLHQSNNLKYFEVFVNTSLQICEQRDTKGLYKKARQGLIPKFTGVSDPYEPSKDCQLQINSGIETVEESFAKLTNYLFKNYLFSQVDQVQLYQYVDYTCDIDDLNLLQVFLQKWTQVPSFMNYHQILESIYFKTYSIANQRYFQPIPLFTLVSKEFAEKSKNHSNIKVRFINPINKSTIAILQNPQFELFRFEEFSNKIFGISSQKHPKIEQLKNKGQYILSGEKLIFKCLRIFFNDGLDYLRKDVQQIKDIIKSVGADCVFGFQLRNPLHNGHLFLLQNARNSLIKKGYKKPMLLLHPCGGWVKEDDVPLSVRVKQHEQLLKNNDKFKDIVFELAIWPSPMYYAGPLQVLWHIKSREMLGINYMVVGRDPAGIKHPLNPSADLYDPFDGQRVIEIAIKLNYIKTQIIPFKVIAWNKVRKQLMEFNQESKQQFETISGSQMRKMAKNNEQVPEWFMGKSSWNILKSYYQVNA